MNQVTYWIMRLLLSVSLLSGTANAYEISGFEFQPGVLIKDQHNNPLSQTPGVNFSLNFTGINEKTELSLPVNRFSVGAAGTVDCCNTNVLDIDLQLLLFTNNNHTGIFAGPFLRAQRLSFSSSSSDNRSNSGFRAGIGMNVGVRYNCAAIFNWFLADVFYPIFYCSTGVRAGYMSGNFRAADQLYGRNDLAINVDLIRFGIRVR